MTEVPAGKAASFEDGSRRIVFHGDIEIGVFRWGGKFYAYENLVRAPGRAGLRRRAHAPGRGRARV